MKKHIFSRFSATILMLTGVVLVTGCNSSDEDETTGYINFYHGSANAPEIHLTIDEDIETSESDEVEVTYNGVAYGEGLGNAEFDSQSYYFELAWQDDDSTDRTDLEMIYQDQLSVSSEAIQFIVLSGDVQTPTVDVFDIPVIDDEDDDTYDRFNLRLLNIHASQTQVDVYTSGIDETFNEATLIGSVSTRELTENYKLDQGSYIVYLTASGETDVLFQSSTMEFAYSSQYVFVLRENKVSGTSPFIVDRVSNSSTIEYIDVDAQAQYSVFNAITTHELLDEYRGDIDVAIINSDMPDINELSYGEISDVTAVENGDYSINVTASETSYSLLRNHLLSLPENSNKTIFLFSDENAVDEDGDGDTDENGDGIIDELEVNIHSMVIENSSSKSIYDHQINIVNLVDTDDFGSVTVYFVRYDETIETASLKSTLAYGTNDDLMLTNNTYQVYVVAQDGSSSIVLNHFELVLNEETSNQFIVLEKDDYAPTGYKYTLLAQPFLADSL